VPVTLSDVFGDPNVGIFSFANEQVAILPAGATQKKLEVYKQALDVEAYGIGIADSRLVGIYVTGNSNAVLVPYITTNDEQKHLESRLKPELSTQAYHTPGPALSSTPRAQSLALIP